jgi:chromosome segregation protein
MSLKQLELTGFKSFATKTTLDFSSGIAAVVGPNGSGKSNVIDAIRWLLGEREAKNMRGGRAEDLIFAGTPNRPRVGMARATITFDNRDNTFPSEYKEIAVSRKVTRDGTSQYYLNDAEVRLKDIVAFFAESRLGTKGLTIVNQGNSDIFVRATSKERRSMIEEILGLRQYQIKKHEAHRKLISTRFNLEKVEAMVEELKPRLRLLRRQAARFEKQAEIEIELKDLEAQYYGVRLGQLASEEKSISPQLESVEKKISIGQAELQKLEDNLAKVEASGPKENKSFEEYKSRRNQLLEKRSRVQQEIGRLEAKIELLSSEKSLSGLGAREAVTLLEEVWEALDQFIEGGDWDRAELDLRPLLDRIEQALRGQSDEKVSVPPGLEDEKNKLFAELKDFDKELKKLDEVESKLTGDLEGFNRLFKDAFGATDAKRSEIRKLEDERNNLNFQAERIKMRREEVSHMAEQADLRLEDFKPVTGVLLDLEGAEKRLFQLRAELAGIGELDSSLVQEAKEVEERHQFLTTQLEDLDKASGDLEQLINDLDQKLHTEFSSSLRSINDQFNHFFKLMFGGGKGELKLVKPEPVKRIENEDLEITEEDGLRDQDETHPIDHGGIEVEVNIPRKKIKGLDMLSGGERSLVSIAALFALISVSPPPFLVLDEVDAALDEGNARRFADIVKDFSKKTQFVIVTHNRATMEAADILYGVTMGDDGTSKVVSLKLES